MNTIRIKLHSCLDEEVAPAAGDRQEEGVTAAIIHAVEGEEVVDVVTNSNTTIAIGMEVAGEASSATTIETTGVETTTHLEEEVVEAVNTSLLMFVQPEHLPHPTSTIPPLPI